MTELQGTSLLTGLGMDLIRIQMVSDADPFSEVASSDWRLE